MPTPLSIQETINRILMNYDTEENDKNIELFIQALRHSEGLKGDCKVDFTKCTSSVKEEPLEDDDTDDIEEQLLTMRCFEEIDYYYIDKLACHIKDI